MFNQTIFSAKLRSRANVC